MKKLFVFTLLASGVWLSSPSRSEVSPWPLQIETRVPFEPSAFVAQGRSQLVYELYLTNYTSSSLRLSRIEVLSGDSPGGQSIAVFEEQRLDELLQPLGVQTTATESGAVRQLAAGGTVVAFMWITLEPGTPVPSHLRHRIISADSVAEGAVIGTHHTAVKVLRSPVLGSGWLASDAPSNDRDNHHRRGIFVLNGRSLISRRYAIDWKLVHEGESFSGDKRDEHSYYSYGKPVVAVADGIIVVSRDGLPENVPGHNEEFHAAVPITPETVGGNMIEIDLGGQQFAQYMHLKPGSLLVKVGERVKAGQVIAQIGTSGDAREPHLHFQVADSLDILGSEGLPYLIDHFRIKSVNGWESRTRELPLKDVVIDFTR